MKPLRVLVPLEPVEPCAEVLSWASSLAGRSRAELTLLSVIEWPGRSGAAASVFQADYDAGLAKRREMENRLLSLAAGSPWMSRREPRTMVRFGSPAEEILAAAGELPADLIVMGTRGRRGVARAFLGSVAESVLRRAPCPVTVIRAGARISPEKLAAGTGNGTGGVR